MKRLITSLAILAATAAAVPLSTISQDLSTHLEELTAPDFIKAVEASGETCIIPLGIMEKHGPHLPLGTDLFLAREISGRASKIEYTIIFPPYYFGQIFEAKHQPGTISYSAETMWTVLQETCDELSRNGIKKIILVNGHGGNNNFLQFFCQAQLAEKRDYSVIFFRPSESEKLTKELIKLRKTDYGGHADEEETSMMLATVSDVVHADRASQQSGKDQERMSHLENAYTGIWWYASYPNHYAGDGTPATKAIGDLIINDRAAQLAKLIKTVKEEDAIEKLQQQFYQEAENPLETEQ